MSHSDVAVSRRRARSVVTGVCVLGLVAVLSSGAASAATSKKATKRTAAKSSSAVIRLGMISPALDSSDPAIGRAGAEAAVAAINKEGGVGGRKLEIKYCDAGDIASTTPESTAKCVRELVNDQKVLAALGQTFNESTKLAEDGGLPLVGVLAGNTGDFTSPNVFLNEIGFLNVGGQAALAVDVGKASNICLPYLEGPGGGVEGLVNGLVLGPRNLKISKAIPIAYTATDVSSQAAAMRGCDAIVVALTLDLTVRLYQTARQLGIDTPFYMPGSVFSEFAIKKNLGNATNVFIASPFKRSGAGWDAYKKDIAAFGKADTQFDNTEALRTWLAVRQIRDALLKIGVTKASRATVLAQFRKTAGYDTGGATPPLDYTVKATLGGGNFPNLINPTVVPYEWKGGKYVETNGGQFVNPFVAPKA